MSKLRYVSLCSGYGAECIAFKRLRRDNPGFEFECVAWSEIEPNAIKAHDAIHPEYAGRNLGDMTTADYSCIEQPIDVLFYSTPCFTAGTHVHTLRGYVPIEEVTTADYVLTHTNNYQKVLAVGNRNSAPLLRVRGMCINDILCTPNHPFFARKRYKTWNKDRHTYDRMFDEAEWIPAELLSRDYYIGYAINNKAELPNWNGVVVTRWNKPKNTLSDKFTTKSFWYLMGRYVGDGWQRNSSHSKGIVICCSVRNESELIKAIKDAGFSASKVVDKTVTKYFIYSKELLEFVKRYGKYAYGKMVDEDTISLPPDLLGSFLDGVSDSDGCWNETEKCWQLTTVSETLAYGIQQCVAKVYKRPCSITYCKRPEKHTICGRKVNQRDTYMLRWHIDNRKQDKAFYENGIIWFPISGICKEERAATVYNMEVETDNSYTANGAIVHNCQSVSTAGKQAGMKKGDDNAASALIWHTERAIRELHPRICILENVRGMVNRRNRPDFDAWLDVLTSYGYVNFWQILNAKDYGVAQNRERVFVVSILDDIGLPAYQFPTPVPLTKTIEDYMVAAESVRPDYYVNQERVTRKVLGDILNQRSVFEEMEKLYHEEWRERLHGR